MVLLSVKLNRELLTTLTLTATLCDVVILIDDLTLELETLLRVVRSALRNLYDNRRLLVVSEAAAVVPCC